MSVSHILPAAPVILGLLAALTWGAADFCGGLATRRTTPERVVLLAHGVSLALLVWPGFDAAGALTPHEVVEGLLSGVVGGAALMIFYRALALGAMGLSAALAGLLTALLPVLASLHAEGLPGRAQLAGFVLAGIAILLIASTPSTQETASSHTPGRALLLSTCAGVGFGFQLIWLHMAASGHGPGFGPVLRALMFSRMGGAGIALAVMLAKPIAGRPRPFAVRGTRLASAPGREQAAWLGVMGIAVAAGLLDSSGNALYMSASLAGRLDVSAVLSSLYPGGTILLAVIFLRERPGRMQVLGMLMALGAVLCIAA